MTRDYFHRLVELIRGHSVYKTKKVPQRPVEQQLLVALKQFGCFGNGASVGMLARYFAISDRLFHMCAWLMHSFALTNQYIF